MMSEGGSLYPPRNCLSIPFNKLAAIFSAERAEEFALRKIQRELILHCETAEHGQAVGSRSYVGEFNTFNEALVDHGALPLAG